MGLYCVGLSWRAWPGGTISPGGRGCRRDVGQWKGGEQMALDEKLSILDIQARDQRGRQFNVEMQMLATGGLRQRVLYYWAQLYMEQLEPREDYRDLCPTISVCFVDGVVFPAISAYHLVFRLLEPEHGVALTEDLSIHFFELRNPSLTGDHDLFRDLAVLGQQ